VADGPALIAGLDAGASKSLALLSDDQGRVLARAKGPGLSLLGPPRPEQLEALRSLMDGLLKEGGVPWEALSFVGLGMSGVDFDDEFSAQKQGLAAGLGLNPAKIALVNDGVVALWGASPSPRSVILQHGSGATAAYRSALGEERPFDHLDVGGLFDLRVEAVKAARRMLDGRLPISPLLAKIEIALGVRGKRALSDAQYRRQLPPQAVAQLAAVVFAAWTDGDGNAAHLVDKALEDYALAALAMAHLSGASELYFGGGVIQQAPPAFWERLRGRIRRDLPAAQIAPPRLGPDFGACLMAGFHAGLDLQILWDGFSQ
jgi:N-acetylglucosamine kinase-like BadF-type ATPase